MIPSEPGLFSSLTPQSFCPCPSPIPQRHTLSHNTEDTEAQTGRTGGGSYQRTKAGAIVGGREGGLVTGEWMGGAVSGIRGRVPVGNKAGIGGNLARNGNGVVTEGKKNRSKPFFFFFF